MLGTASNKTKPSVVSTESDYLPTTSSRQYIQGNIINISINNNNTTSIQ